MLCVCSRMVIVQGRKKNTYTGETKTGKLCPKTKNKIKKHSAGRNLGAKSLAL